MKQSHIPPFNETCLVRTHHLFRHLTDAEIEKVNADSEIEYHKRGTIIYHEGNRINGFYCIQKGIAKIFKTGIDGKEQIIRFAKKAEIIGFRSVLSKELACSTAEVIEDTISCYIPSETLVELIKNNGNFALELLQLTCRELGEANSFITDIAQKTVRERLAEILVHLHQEFGINSESVLQISLTREELANIVGTATESVIRLLSEFKQDSFIDINGRKIKILNLPGLMKLGNVYN